MLLGAAACSDREVVGPTPSGPASATTAGPPPPAAEPAADPACAEKPGRTVTALPDLEVPAVTVPPVVDPGSGDELVAGLTVPGQTVDAGCVVRYAAPGGCLGAVTISAATIPAVTIPASTVAAAARPDGTEVGDWVYAAVTRAAVTQPAVTSPQVCRVTRQGRERGVTRAGVVREGFSRDGLARPGGVRPGRCDGDDCVPEVRVDTVRVPPVRLPDVDVDPERLPTRELAGRRDVDVVGGAGGGAARTSYVAPATALFAEESARLSPSARSALAAIARRIRATAPGARLLVEGHTDDQGSAAIGLTLSQRRAEAVADWLAGRGFDRSRIRTEGYGEADPVVPNTSAANRARNRRVVITVLR